MPSRTVAETRGLSLWCSFLSEGVAAFTRKVLGFQWQREGGGGTGYFLSLHAGLKCLLGPVSKGVLQKKEEEACQEPPTSAYLHALSQGHVVYRSDVQIPLSLCGVDSTRSVVQISLSLCGAILPSLGGVDSTRKVLLQGAEFRWQNGVSAAESFGGGERVM